MRMKLTFETKDDRNIVLPVHYNHIIQAFIYNNISKDLAEFLHNKGYVYEKRLFKLFVFSRIFSKTFHIKDDRIGFGKRFYFYISSPINEFIKQIAESFLKTEADIKIGENNLIIKELFIPETPNFQDTVKINMLSPITIYSTVVVNNKRKTYYYSPFEDEFQELIKANLKKKYTAFTGERLDFDFKIKPISVNKNFEKLIYYKDTIVKGWMGKYEIITEKKILEFAYDAGLGSKNSQGFGMFEICL